MKESKARQMVEKMGAREFIRMLAEEHGISKIAIGELMRVGRGQVRRYIDGRSAVPQHRIDNLLAAIDGLV